MWSLENKSLLHVIQLPAKVRLVRQLEFINNSFDGGTSQVRNRLHVPQILIQWSVHTEDSESKIQVTFPQVRVQVSMIQINEQH